MSGQAVDWRTYARTGAHHLTRPDVATARRRPTKHPVPPARAPRRTTRAPSLSYDPRDARRRIGSILSALGRAYPGARTALRYRNPFELLVATILSAQSTDETVNRVTPDLFARYPGPAALAAADPADVEQRVRPTGFFRNKTKAIIGCAREIEARFGGCVPATVDELVTLPGVARKTANVVLANCWPRPASDHGIFVDTHVHRVSQRLALTGEDEPERIERDLLALVPESKWADFPHQLVFLGRGPCTARNPRHQECPLLRWCPTGQQAIAPTQPERSRARAPRVAQKGHGRAGRARRRHLG
jgi:endonuclease III